MIRKLFKRETRTGFTDIVVAGLEATVGGTSGNLMATGALEVCAGLWARALAAARVEGAAVLTARIRHQIGRDLIRTGESVFLIDTLNGSLRLEPTAQHQVTKGWRYDLHLAQPDGTMQRRNVARDSVLHLMWAVDPARPWEGVSPLGAASLLGKLASGTESKLGEDLATPVAHLLPTPTDGGATALDTLRSDIGSARGKAVLAQGTSSGWEEGRTQAGTNKDWQSSRLGPEIPEQLRALYGDVLGAVAQVCGIPASLVQHQNVDGTESREAYRRWIMANVQPVADMIAEAASAALEDEVVFDFRGLWAHDFVGRASAFQKLTAGGMSAAEAREIVGL